MLVFHGRRSGPNIPELYGRLCPQDGSILGITAERTLIYATKHMIGE